MQTIRQMREGLGMSQDEFKDELNRRTGRSYDRSTISRWENSAKQVPKEIMRAIRSMADNTYAPLRTIAFANHKGGVGKTTSALNISSALSRMGYRTLLIDMDPQASATHAIAGLAIAELYKGRPNMRHALIEHTPLSDIIIRERTDLNGLVVPFDFCPSHIDLSEVDIRRESGIDYLLREQIVSVSDEYDFVLLDCPPHLGTLTWISMIAATSVIIPVRTEPYDVMGIHLLLSTMKKAKRNYNPTLEIGGFLPTQYSGQQYVDREILRFLFEQLAATGPVLEPIPASSVFGNAAYSQRVAMDDKPNHRALQGYVKLAAAIAGTKPFPLIDPATLADAAE